MVYHHHVAHFTIPSVAILIKECCYLDKPNYQRKTCTIRAICMHSYLVNTANFSCVWKSCTVLCGLGSLSSSTVLWDFWISLVFSSKRRGGIVVWDEIVIFTTGDFRTLLKFTVLAYILTVINTNTNVQHHACLTDQININSWSYTPLHKQLTKMAPNVYYCEWYSYITVCSYRLTS